jgi:hypothetical protein
MTAPPSPSTDRDALIAALAEQARNDAPKSAMPEPEELLDYLAGRLAPEDEQRIGRQLVADPAAARALIDLAELEAAGAEAGERPSEIATVAGWRDFQQRLPKPPRRPWRFGPLLPAFAAALLVATVGFGSWAWRLQSALRLSQAELNRPVANVASLELYLGSRASDGPVLELAPGKRLFLVVLGAKCPSYTARVEGPWNGPLEDLKPENGTLSVMLPPLKPGPYKLRLGGCEPGHELEVLRFRITSPRSGGPEG